MTNRAMTFRLRLLFAMTLPAVLACACGRPAVLQELQRGDAGDVTVVLLSPRDAIHHGTDDFILEFRSRASGQLVDVGDVSGSATMPMPGSPMFGSIDIKRTSVAGRYAGEGQFEMAGTWRITIEWRTADGRGAIAFSGRVL